MEAYLHRHLPLRGGGSFLTNFTGLGSLQYNNICSLESGLFFVFITHSAGGGGGGGEGGRGGGRFLAKCYEFGFPNEMMVCNTIIMCEKWKACMYVCM